MKCNDYVMNQSRRVDMKQVFGFINSEERKSYDDHENKNDSANNFISKEDLNIFNKDKCISLFYIFLFAISSGLLSVKFGRNGLVSFAEGFAISIIFIGIITGLLLLSFRFFTKIKYSFMDMLSTLSASFVFMSLFIFTAASGRGNLLNSAGTIIAAISAGTILHYLSLKRFSGLENDRLIANIILVYFVFYSIISFVLNLALPVQNFLTN